MATDIAFYAVESPLPLAVLARGLNSSIDHIS